MDTSRLLMFILDNSKLNKSQWRLHQQPLGGTTARGNWLRLVYVNVILILLSGCAARTITIESSFPPPLVSKIPLTIGVYYPESLRTFSYTEIDDYSGKDQYIVNSGQSQIKLFETILPQMFTQVVNLDTPDTDNAAVDAVLTPTLNVFQLGLPDKTKLKVFEIWMQYNMRLTAPNGDFIADWNMSAYGKAPTESFKSIDSGVQNAAEVAMRDMAASFTLGFTEIPDVKDWLRTNNNTP